MIGKGSAAIALALLGAASAVRAQEAPAAGAKPPRLALALSGGGARGIAHIGVLKAFEESGIPVDAIAGTSMGAVVGSIYATGRNAAELERTVKSLDWASIFSGQPDRRLIPVSRREDEPRPVGGIGLDFWKLRLPAGVFAEYRVNRFFLEALAGASYAAGGDFDRLPIPFHAIAAGLDDGRRVVLTKGDLARAVRASMSIPLAFPPVLWEGRPLVDGGVVDNLPVKEARTFGATVVVGVDVGSPALEPVDWASAFGVAAQVNRLLSDRANAEFQEEPDVLVRPDLGKHSFNDYTGLDKLIMRGYEAGIRALPQIRERLGPLAEAPAPARPAPVRTLEGTSIAEVEVEGNERYSDALIRRTFSIPVGPPFDMKKGLNALDRIHATGFFDSAWMDLEPVEAGLRIVLRVKDGPANRVELGVGYDEEDGPRGFVQFKNRNTLGFGEQTSLTVFASSSSEGVLGRFSGDRLLTTLVGFEVRARALTEKPRYFDPEGEYINRARFERRDVRFALRRGIKRTWLFAVELNVGSVETVERLGLDFPLGEDDVRTASFVVVHDNLDDPAYPRSRLRFELRGDTSATGMGADPEFWRLEGSTRLAVPAGSDTTIQVDGWAGFSGDELPVYERYRLGGPVLLPGHHIEEQWGAQVLAASLTVRHQIFRSVHLVARAGAGNVWERREDIAWEGLRYGASLGLYRPTPIGPVAVDFGVRRGGGTLATLSIGFP